MEGLRMVPQKHTEGLQRFWKHVEVLHRVLQTHEGSLEGFTNTWRAFIECYSTQGGSSEGNIKHMESLLST
jgi:hypothetical protein